MTEPALLTLHRSRFVPTTALLPVGWGGGSDGSHVVWCPRPDPWQTLAAIHGLEIMSERVQMRAAVRIMDQCEFGPE